MNTDKIVYINGGYGASQYSERTLAAPFTQLLKTNECIVADDAYAGSNYMGIVANANTAEKKEFNARVRRILARQESVNQRIKEFGFFNKRVRQSQIFVNDCFRCVCNILNVNFGYRPLSINVWSKIPRSPG